ncbi:PilT/PilU family type 4a pilus ATPase [Leucothrix arctica]|uniref:Type IV pili twitching motility protein PilT n=1 Tax=Leucothrix arctica TaxID=1481894 RepID=A0A317C3J1_9GAMM|nr:PilT/PilU family type 4a pilus ATPase [Leucothrix arctica]PWQ93148.1 type IV pili twitching motility protein PilT [Leucothrix arctica]
MDKESAMAYVHSLLHNVLKLNGSDLFVTAGAPPSVKVSGLMKPLSNQKLNEDQARMLVRSIMNDKQMRNFEEHMEGNFSISLPGSDRFRVNAFTQRGCAGMVLRHIPSDIPSFKKLGIPPVLKDLTMTTRGLIIMVGSTGSGKSTTLAAMVDLRNEATQGHIITIEDPIEFTHQHKGCLITQREIGLDTEDYEIAMKNTLRQAPDVILLGEVRDRESMEYAISYAETGHLCMTTLHANSTNQAIDRIINFFPEERREQLLMDLSLNLKAIVSQRLTRTKDGKGRFPAVEVMINSPMMADLILKGDIAGMKELMAKSNQLGMCTFDQALFQMIDAGLITVQEGMRNADSINDLRLQLKLHSRKAKGGDFFEGTDSMSIEDVYDEAAL